MTSEGQVIVYDLSVTSMVLMLQNGRKCITYIYYINKHLLTGSGVVLLIFAPLLTLYFGRHGVLLNSKLHVGQYDVYCSKTTLHVTSTRVINCIIWHGFQEVTSGRSVISYADRGVKDTFQWFNNCKNYITYYDHIIKQLLIL